MKAIVLNNRRTADALDIADVDQPVPEAHQVLVRVRAASLNALDLHRVHSAPLLRRAMAGSRPPIGLGVDLAGTVEVVGSAVTAFKPGDNVFGVGKDSLAEFALANERKLILMPAGMTFEAVAAAPVAALSALQGLRDSGGLKTGERVLIQGASGGVGSFAVQIARALGAEVTAVCSPRNIDMVRGLGATHVIDYTREDFTTSGRQYDSILAINGYHPITAYRRALRPAGRFIMVGASAAHLIPAMFQSLVIGRFVGRNGQRMGSMGVAQMRCDDLAWVCAQMVAGTVVPVIDRCYPLADAAAAARYADEVHARGKVVIVPHA